MYGSKQDMIDRYGEEELIQLTDRVDAGIIDDTVLDQARADADAEIDGYLAGRYQLPLAEVPPSLVRVACEITRYHLYDDAVTDNVKDRYDNAVRFLRALAKGDVTMVQSTGAAADTSESAGVAEFETSRSVFTGGGF
ncbi:MAG: gp436 family protein [Desulfobulbia bacterium]